MPLNEKTIQTDFCVIGGGVAGTFAAITAARLGVRTVLVHERPVFGGNASGEIRMWVCGAQQRELREAGLQEEWELENAYFNPTKNWYLFDTLLYDMVAREKNLTALPNTTCFDADCEHTGEGGSIRSITAYQMTTQTRWKVEAAYFADCSGDSILAPLTGAHFMYGREAAGEYGEETVSSRESGDRKTMGNSRLLQARETDHKIPFIAPDFAEKVSVEKLKSKRVNLQNPSENFWYLELGGNGDVIGDAETVNRRLLSLCLGAWDTIKNSGAFDADNFDLEFLGFLPAKRESRRMRGDYVLTAGDILRGGPFADTVAYGGWGLDDHNPDGFDGEKSNRNQPLPGAYGIPYRCLYSENVENLFFAGRNISATHMAMSSARVMGSCGCLGQAVGCAAFVAKKYDTTPRGAGAHVAEIQQLLLHHDCYLPHVSRSVSPLCRSARLTIRGASAVADPEKLRDGQDRNLEKNATGIRLANGSRIVYDFGDAVPVEGVKIVFDSDLLRRTVGTDDPTERFHSTRANILFTSPVMRVPQTHAKHFRITGTGADGKETVLFETERNLRRNVLLAVCGTYKTIALTVFENYGGTAETGLFTFEVY